MARASDLLHGLVISAACQALPVRKVYTSSGDLLDNEWPIEWSMAEIQGNSHFTLDSVVYRKVSDVSIDAECSLPHVGERVIDRLKKLS